MARIDNAVVFISYADADAYWAEEFKKHLLSVNQQFTISIVGKGEMKPGDAIESTISDSLNRSALAVALVSADYLSSEGTQSEIDRLVSAERSGKLRFLPLIVRACIYENSLLSNYHPFNKKPLESMTTEDQCALLVSLANYIVQFFTIPSAQPTGSALTGPTIFTDALLDDPAAYLHAVRARRFNPKLPLGLEKELAGVFRKVDDVERIIRISARIIDEAFSEVPGGPKVSPLPEEYVALAKSARAAWDSALSEAPRVGPRALAALLLAARAETENDLPIVRKTLGLILARTE